MSILSAVKAILEADATLLGAATGGIWDWDETGRLGLSLTNTPGAFDANGIIKPAIMVKLRSSTPDYDLADDTNQYVTTRDMIEIWLYQDTGYGAIDTMRARVYALLHAKQLTNNGVFAIRWAGDIRNARDTEIDANVERSDFAIRARRSV